jgi:hypothetical protein
MQESTTDKAELPQEVTSDVDVSVNERSDTHVELLITRESVGEELQRAMFQSGFVTTEIEATDELLCNLFGSDAEQLGMIIKYKKVGLTGGDSE